MRLVRGLSSTFSCRCRFRRCRSEAVRRVRSLSVIEMLRQDEAKSTRPRLLLGQSWFHMEDDPRSEESRCQICAFDIFRRRVSGRGRFLTGLPCGDVKRRNGETVQRRISNVCTTRKANQNCEGPKGRVSRILSSWSRSDVSSPHKTSSRIIDAEEKKRSSEKRIQHVRCL